MWVSGEAYERYAGRWSRLVGVEFLKWLEPAPGLRWLEVGCGTGGLSQTILRLAAPAEVYGIDSSQGFITLARKQVPDSRAYFVRADARSLPCGPAFFDLVVSGLVLNFIPAPGIALQEMKRVAVAGGSVAAYVWDYSGQMQFMRLFWDAAVALDPKAAGLDEGKHFVVCQPEPLAQLFREAGFEQVEVRAIDIPTVFRNFNDYWEPFLGGVGPAPAYVATLVEDRKVLLRERLRRDLPVESDGSIHLAARAWAVRGLKPA